MAQSLNFPISKFPIPIPNSQFPIIQIYNFPISSSQLPRLTISQFHSSPLYQSNNFPISQIPNFPISGSSAIDLADIKKNKTLELVTKNDKNSIAIYKVN